MITQGRVLAQLHIIIMATVATTKGKRKERKLSFDSSSSAKKSRTISFDYLTCSLKSCVSKPINPTTEGHVEIQAGLPDGDISSFLGSSTVSWTRSGDAVFHKNCWKELAKSSRVRKSKNATIKLSEVEKSLIKEAVKTPEWYDSYETLQREASRIAGLLRNSKHCVAFTGAGISTSAGIGDYRGKGGKWTEMDREVLTAKVADELVNPTDESSGKEEDEDGVPYEQLRPTYTHEALVKLMEMGLLKHITSQNGDGLHGLSGISPSSLSELHGNVFLELCEKCGHRYYRLYYVMDDEASQYFEEVGDDGRSQIKKPKHASKCGQCGLNHRTGRKCEQKDCSGSLKDSIINFGDNLEESILNTAEENAAKTDLCLSLGSTMQVTPACELITKGQKPLRLVIVNRQKTDFDDFCYDKDESGKQLGSRVFGNCDQLMQEVMAILLSEEERRAWEGGREDRMKQYDSFRKQV